MDELLDVLDTDGTPTGETKLKSEVHRLGLFHHTVHIWCYTLDGHVLLQQRGKDKNTFPLLWDVSVAGHIGAGETVIDGAMREMEEEIGLTAEAEQFEKIFTFKSLKKPTKGLIDNELHHVFLFPLEVALSQLKKQENEVAALRFLPVQHFKREILENNNGYTYVPHSDAYYATVLSAMRQRIPL
ncbi:NUDIX hydrolase [Maribacter sp. 2-571]|uniref:NUDIX hydrolase n=1 Tax=Maribacter sp. 2-571 TaxID=3417569 RepID=UPI003D34182D